LIPSDPRLSSLAKLIASPNPTTTTRTPGAPTETTITMGTSAVIPGRIMAPTEAPTGETPEGTTIRTPHLEGNLMEENQTLVPDLVMMSGLK
jgi:hypothetical protein